MDIYTVIGVLTLGNLSLGVLELYLFDKMGMTYGAATAASYERIRFAFLLTMLLPLAFMLPEGITEVYALFIAGFIKMSIENILYIRKASAARWEKSIILM